MILGNSDKTPKQKRENKVTEFRFARERPVRKFLRDAMDFREFQVYLVRNEILIRFGKL